MTGPARRAYGHPDGNPAAVRALSLVLLKKGHRWFSV